jgi:hypothetical protein
MDGHGYCFNAVFYHDTSHCLCPSTPLNILHSIVPLLNLDVFLTVYFHPLICHHLAIFTE